MRRHRAVGPWHPTLDPADLQIGLRHMLTNRMFDDRMATHAAPGADLFLHEIPGRRGRLGRAGAMALEPSDMLFPSYRNQGLQIARGRNPVDLMCQCLSNSA